MTPGTLPYECVRGGAIPLMLLIVHPAKLETAQTTTDKSSACLTGAGIDLHTQESASTAGVRPGCPTVSRGNPE